MGNYEIKQNGKSTIVPHGSEEYADIYGYATPDDIAAHAAAMEEYRRGETVAHEDIDWN